MNIKTPYLIKKYLDTKLEEFKAKSINLKHTKPTKYHYVLMIKDLLKMMGFIHQLILLKS